ncbi:MAG TPA: response regulator [Candidatus Eisenbergiella merdigallinarum]|uniref:Stage 0 sporulation protein A homolog n=1 Tax=Candidatus Eisenbergiella merdigallinarum TaxID=2838552 RepID=A0A9D2MU04_9FIRM|nr:response regulator [Candidatus Eisenbergiella merdigallinarum]
MYRVLIVEDELFVRLGIKMSVEWEKLDMEVIADVSNGEQAWEVYVREEPDIILTDLKMPIMDGMELIRRVREKSDRTRIIILSCLEEFALVRESISMDVTDYILKLTMTREDMEKVLDKARTELEALKRAREPAGVSPEKQRQELLDFFYYNTWGEREYGERLRKIGLPFGEKNLLMAELEINRYEEVQKRFGDDYGVLVDSALLNVLTELMEEHGGGMVMKDRQKCYLIIAGYGSAEQKAMAEYGFERFLAKARKTLSMYFQIAVTIGISQLFDGYENLGRMYQQCRYCLDQTFYHMPGENLFYSKIRGEDRTALVRERLLACAEQDGMDDHSKKTAGGSRGTVRTKAGSGCAEKISGIYAESGSGTHGLRQPEKICHGGGERAADGACGNAFPASGGILFLSQAAFRGRPHETGDEQNRGGNRLPY